MRTRRDRGVKHRFGIRFRVAAAAAIVVALTLVLSCAVLVGLMQHSLISNLDATQLARAQDIVGQAAVTDPHGVIRSTAKDTSAVQVLGPSAGMSVMSLPHTAYLASIAFPLAALSAIGAVLLWRTTRDRTSRLRFALPITVAVQTA